MSPPPLLSTRPRPSSNHEQQRVLHSIYQAIDTHNYAKALKLTSPSSSSSSTPSPPDRWDIVRALRIHALERSGKVREALILLWEVIVGDVVQVASSVTALPPPQHLRQTWWELYERIQALTTAEDIIHGGHAATSSSSSSSSSSSAAYRVSGGANNSTRHLHPSLGDIPLFDAVRRLDARSFAPIVNVQTSKHTNTTNNDSMTANTNKLSVKTGGKSLISTNTIKVSSSDSNSIGYCYPPVTDETILQTLSVTLRNCELYDTMSEMYYQATMTLSSPSSISSSCKSDADLIEQEENHRNVLEEGVCVHFRAVCDCSSFDNLDNDRNEKKVRNGWCRVVTLQSQLPKLQSLLNMVKYYERMQTSSLQLAKITLQPLHYQWTAISSLWYMESLEQLVSTMEYVHSLASVNEDDEILLLTKEKQADKYDLGVMLSSLARHVINMMGLDNLNDITTRIALYRQKIAVLPRLAESLSSRLVLPSQQTPPPLKGGVGSSTTMNSSATVVTSEQDWDVYLETLLVQGKKMEAIDVLKKIHCTPMIGDSNVIPPTKIHENSRCHTIDDESTIKNHSGSILLYTERRKLERLAELSREVGMAKDAEGYYRELLRAFPDQWIYWIGLVESSCTRINPVLQRDNCSEDEQCNMIDEEGCQRCHLFAKEIAATANNLERHSLRGPYLILLELAAQKLRQASNHVIISEAPKEAEMADMLRDEICAYGDKFGTNLSCCFADIRSYLQIIVQASASGRQITDISAIPSHVLTLLTWANKMWEINVQSSDTDHTNHGVSTDDELRHRRKKLRGFIFAVQVVYGIASHMQGVSLCVLETYAPPISQLLMEWRTSLAYLPSLAAIDGGQKEVLPGDEIILLTSQYLLFQASLLSPLSNAGINLPLLQSAGLLEEAMDHSPYNHHLKIAAISIYAKLNAPARAFEIFQDMDVKQIQLESCSYVILPSLVKGGLYTPAIKLSASILRMHGSTSKDVKTYASKALRNGLMMKAKEMVKFQCEKMRPSLQLLYSKGLLLAIAPLMISSDLENNNITETKKIKPTISKLASEKGYRGREEDVIRAEQLAVDAEIHFNAPAIIHVCAYADTLCSSPWSDNRDTTINYFEVLSDSMHPSQEEMATESVRRGHIHGLLVRAILAVANAHAPKKGKMTNPSEEAIYRCHSLRYTLTRARYFSQNAKLGEFESAIWNSCCDLCGVIIVIIIGGPDDDSTCATLAERDALATSIINSITQMVRSAQSALIDCDHLSSDAMEKRSFMGGRLSILLPDYIYPLFILLETTSRLFSLVGWGKRKRLTKAASAALASAASSLQDLITDMLQIMTDFRNVSSNLKVLAETSSSTEIGQDTMERVVSAIISSRNLTMDKLDPFLLEMRERLRTYNDES